jgi:hypothetical protein
VRDHHGAAHHQAEHVRRRRRAGARDLLVEDRLLDERRAAAAVLLRPRQPGPAALVELLLPLALELEGVVVAARRPPRVVGLEPCSKLVSECLF